MAYIVAGAMLDSSEQWLRSMETVTAGETARIGGVSRHAGKPEEAVSRAVTEHGRCESCPILFCLFQFCERVYDVRS